MRASRFPLIGLVGLCLSIFSVGSALLASERSDPISVTSLPAGATVIVDGKVEGMTPMVVVLSRKLVHTVRIELEGYRPRAAEVRPEVSWAKLAKNAFGGALFGIVGTAVDLTTGESKRLTPAEVQWTLERVGEVDRRILPVVASRLSGL